MPSLPDKFDRIDWQEPERVPTGWMAQGTLFSGDRSWPVTAWHDRITGHCGAAIKTTGNHRTLKRAFAAKEHVAAEFAKLLPGFAPDAHVRVPQRLSSRPKLRRVAWTEPYYNSKGLWAADCRITTEDNRKWKATLFKYRGRYGTIRITMETVDGERIDHNGLGQTVAHALKSQFIPLLGSERLRK